VGLVLAFGAGALTYFALDGLIGRRTSSRPRSSRAPGNALSAAIDDVAVATALSSVS
jgi:hypothetical protein